MAKPDTKPGFRPVVQKGEADRTEECVREVTGWSDPVEENTGFVEAVCRNYEAVIVERRVGKTRGAGPSGRYDTRSGPKRHDATQIGSQEKENDEPTEGSRGASSRQSHRTHTKGSAWYSEKGIPQ